MPTPSKGPYKVPTPPKIVIRTTSPEAVHCILSAPANGSVTAINEPANPANMPEITKAVIKYGRVL